MKQEDKRENNKVFLLCPFLVYSEIYSPLYPSNQH